MLLPRDISPNDSLYFHGGQIIQVLKRNPELGFVDLFLESNATRDIPMAVFALALDWLYLANVVRYNKNEKIELCF